MKKGSVGRWDRREGGNIISEQPTPPASSLRAIPSWKAEQLEDRGLVTDTQQQMV